MFSTCNYVFIIQDLFSELFLTIKLIVAQSHERVSCLPPTSIRRRRYTPLPFQLRLVSLENKIFSIGMDGEGMADGFVESSLPELGVGIG